MLPYYYSTLNKENQALYTRIRTCLYQERKTASGTISINLGVAKKEINIEDLTKQLSLILVALKKDDPWMFWCDFSHFIVTNKNCNISLSMGFYYTAQEIRAQEIEVNKWLKERKKILWVDDMEKRERRAYGFLKKNVEYKDTEHFEEHTIWGVIHNKKAVCEGISHTFALLCRELNIPCIVVHGRGDTEVKTSDNNNSEIEYNHAWNMVRVHNSLYYVDLTNDLNNVFTWEYFNKTKKEMEKDHFIPEELPIC